MEIKLNKTEKEFILNKIHETVGLPKPSEFTKKDFERQKECLDKLSEQELKNIFLLSLITLLTIKYEKTPVSYLLKLVEEEKQ